MYQEAQSVTLSSHQWVEDTPTQTQKQEMLTVMHPLPAPYPPRPALPNVSMSGPVAEASDPEDSASGFKSEDGSIPNPIMVQQQANEWANEMEGLFLDLLGIVFIDGCWQ